LTDGRVCVFQATVSVGGRTHSAMSIEHFILRLPYSAKQVRPAALSSVAIDTAICIMHAWAMPWARQ
jgi:hypothetical protein